MIRLLGDVAGTENQIEAKRAMLLEGLRSLIDADRWVWTLMGYVSENTKVPHTLFLHGGFAEGELTKYLEIQEHSDLKWMTEKFFTELQETEKNVTRLGQQLVTEEQLAGADIYPHLVQANLGPIALFGRSTRNGQVSVISFFRTVDRPLFSSRDARIIHIILSEVQWMHENSWPNHPREEISRLSPRLRTVLCLMIQGASRKTIARELSLSLHTVHGYIKHIYQALGVHSQSELICRFIEGDGGDRVVAR
ncbi:MAG: LuxR C-terminal-related transcriptional regulator [Verrucomicrobiales bacterium]|nr:LuxR C-terminal-related transcriptional regulator [Verrucomicrobiales bacterium]